MSNVVEYLADTICRCYMTDGFCAPRNIPACRCWGLARAVTHTLAQLPDPAMGPGWKVTHAAFVANDKADPRAVLNAILKGATP